MASTRHRGWLKSRPNLVFLKNKIIGKVTSKAVFKPYVFAAFLGGSSGAKGIGKLDMLQTGGSHGAKDKETAYVIRDVIHLRSH